MIDLCRRPRPGSLSARALLAVLALLAGAATPAFSQGTVVWCGDADARDECKQLHLEGDAVDLSELSDNSKVFRTGKGGVMYLGDGDQKPRFLPWENVFTPRAYVGVNLTDLTAELRRHFGVDEDEGVMVSRVEKDSPAALAGVRVGDIITRVDGKAIQSPADVSRSIGRKQEGDSADLEIWRQGSRLVLAASVAQRDRRQVDVGKLMGMWQNAEDSDQNRFLLQLDPEAITDTVKRFEAMVKNKADDGRQRRIQILDSDLRERMRALEERLQELERDLADADER